MNTLFKPTHIHSKLDGSWLYLHEQMPPQKWAALPSFGTAATWLGMHHSLRRGQQGLDAVELLLNVMMIGIEHIKALRQFRLELAHLRKMVRVFEPVVAV